MLKKISFFFSLLLFTVVTFGQVTGKIRDTSSAASVKNAVVAILTPKDSVLKGFARVQDDGSFSVANIKPGNYVLSVTHPLFADFVDDIAIKSANQTLPLIALTPKSKLLEAVILKSGNPIRLRGDTTIYTADSFKVSANANVEELLKKLPGIQVDKNGQIKAMGVTVEKVLVDGEEFFGDDPGMAVKNLRADAVKEVQVFDKKSDQAEFTGIDDGKTQKTINLKLKEDKKKGYFGKIDGAGGPVKNLDARYNTNILLSSFKGKRKISGFLLSGNTGQDGLSWQDEQKYAGESDNMTMSVDDDGGVMYMYRGGGSDDEPYLDTENGYITNVNAGVQYSNKFKEKITLNLSPKYNSQVYSNNKQTVTRRFGNADSVLNELADAFTHINRNNLKLRGTYDIKLDSFNTLKLTANTNFYQTASSENKFGSTSDQDDKLINNYTRSFRTDNDKQALSGNIIFKHKFRKLRRTLSATADWRSVNTDGTNYLSSQNNFFSNSFSQSVDQMKDYDKQTTNLTTRLSYTEPLGKNYSMEVGYQLGLNNGKNDETTYDKTPASGKYETPVDSLTNNFRQKIIQHTPSLRLNYTYKKVKINAGAGVGFTDFNLDDLTFNKEYNRKYTNFTPSASLNYTYKSNHNLRVNYNGSTVQPTINQLQPLRNNNDFLNQYIGNPDLRPAFRNSLNLSHNSYNFIKDIWMYQSFNVNRTQRGITNSRTTDYSTGRTVTRPVNTDGNMSISFWSGGGFKLKKIDTRIGVNPNISYNKTANIINGQKLFSKNLNTGISFDVSKSKDKKYDVSVGSNLTYTSNTTTGNSNKIHYFSNTLSANGTVYYKKVWSIVSDYRLYTKQKTTQAPAFDNSLWNARLQRTFKDNEFTAYFSVRDILNQNRGLERNFSDAVFIEERNDRLKRYCLVGFTWDFKNKASKAK